MGTTENKKGAKMTDDEVVVWLNTRFQREESILCARLREEATALGITKKQLKAARQRLGTRTWHQFDEGGATENWFWSRGAHT